MGAIKKRTFSISRQQASYIDSLVKSGAYASASEVVRDGLRLIEARDEEVERWLHTEVAETYDRWKSGKTRTREADEVFQLMREYHRKRAKKTA